VVERANGRRAKVRIKARGGTVARGYGRLGKFKEYCYPSRWWISSLFKKDQPSMKPQRVGSKCNVFDRDLVHYGDLAHYGDPAHFRTIRK